MERDLLTDKLGSELEELSFSEWPDPPGSHPWLPAYGFLPPPQHALDKDDFMDPNDAALFLGCGLGVSAGVAAMGGAGPHGAHFLETIVEETSEQLRCEGASPRPYSWMDDSDQDSVIHVSSVKDDNDSGSERDFLCPAKRRRPNRLTDRASSPSDPDGDQLSRSSSLAQFESLEQSCQLLDSDSPQSLLSLDSLERLKPQLNSADVSPDSLENSSDSELHSSSSQESAYRILSKTESDHFNDRSLPEERFSDATYVVSGQNFDDEAQFWKDDNQKLSDEESNRSSSDFSSDSDKTVQEDVTVIPMRENVASKYNFKSCRSLDALPSLENLDATKIDQSSPSCAKPNCRNRQHVVNGQYSAENLSEDSGYSDHFCNFMRIRSKSNPSVNNAYSKSSLKRKSDDDLLSIFNSKCQRKGEMGCQFGAAGEFRRERSRNEGKSDAALKETKITKRQSVPRPSPSLPDLSADRVSAADYFDPIQARNTLPRKNNNKLINSDNFSSEDANLYSVSSVPKDLNLCEVEDHLDRSFDDNWSFGSERTVSVAAKNFDLCDFAYAKRSHTAVREAASFKQSFRVCESFTTSVADLTVLDYRTEPDGTVKNVMKKFTSSRTSTNSENMARSLPPTREWSAESDSTTESEKIFLNEMEKTMRQLNEQSKNILEKSLDHAGFDRNLSIMTNKRIHSPFNPFDEVIAELEKKQARSHAKNTMKEEPPKAMPEFEFNFYGEDEDPPYYRRHATYEASNSHTEDSSPDVSDSFNGENMFFHSTPMKGTDKVQSTPNLNLHHQDVEDIYSTVAPKEELRSSMQHVPNKNDFKPVGILGSKSQVLSGSASSKGVHFCPVVAEVSWRERSYSEDSTDISSNGSAYSNASCPEDSRFEIEGSPNIPALDILLRKDPETNNGATTKATTDAASVPLPAAVKYHHKMAAPRHNMAVPPPPPPLTPQTNKNISNSPPASARRIFDECACASRDKTTVKTMNESDKMEQNIQKQPSRSRIGGFLSKFASFRFSTRKSKKNDTTKTVNKTGEVNETQNKIGLKLNNHAENNLTAKQNVNNNSGGKINVCSDVATTQDYVYIPLKVETPSGGSGGSGGSGRPPLPPGKTPRSVEHHGKPQNHHIQRRATANGIDSNHWNEDGHHNLPGLLETDLDAVVAAPGAGGLSRSLLTLPPPHSAPRSHKSMEYLLDKENIRDVEPPENDLQKNSADRVLSEHQLRVQRSLQKLNLPDWYKNSPVQREGSLLKKRLSDAGCGWQAQSAAPAAGLSGKTTSLGSLGANHTGSTATVTTPIRREQGFTRWSTSRLNSHQTSPCSSARSSVRSGVSAYSPLPSPSRGPVRAPYLGWRSTERLAPLRTPHQRLAVSLLEANPSAAALPLSSSPPLAAASPATPDNVSSEIQEVTSAIVHYVTSQEEHNHKQQRPCWLESSFVGTKPLESPQTPVVVVGPPQAPAPRPPLQLELTHTRPTLSATSYQNGEYVTMLT